MRNYTANSIHEIAINKGVSKQDLAKKAKIKERYLQYILSDAPPKLKVREDAYQAIFKVLKIDKNKQQEILKDAKEYLDDREFYIGRSGFEHIGLKLFEKLENKNDVKFVKKLFQNIITDNILYWDYIFYYLFIYLMIEIGQASHDRRPVIQFIKKVQGNLETNLYENYNSIAYIFQVLESEPSFLLQSFSDIEDVVNKDDISVMKKLKETYINMIRSDSLKKIFAEYMNKYIRAIHISEDKDGDIAFKLIFKSNRVSPSVTFVKEETDDADDELISKIQLESYEERQKIDQIHKIIKKHPHLLDSIYHAAQSYAEVANNLLPK